MAENVTRLLMPFPLKFASALVLLAFPIIEIALLLKAGATFGFWPVFLVVIATAMAGASVIRAHGLSVLPRFARHIEEGGSGFEPLADAFLAVTAGFLLFSPGLICDLLGAVLCVPIVRKALIRSGLPGALAGKTTNRDGDGRSTNSRPNGRAAGPVIEGEFERIDDDEAEPPVIRPHLTKPN